MHHQRRPGGIDQHDSQLLTIHNRTVRVCFNQILIHGVSLLQPMFPWTVFRAVRFSVTQTVQIRTKTGKKTRVMR